jgi:hypothetical protein
MAADGEGRFRFVNDYPGQLPAADHYRIDISAKEYLSDSKTVADVQQGEDRDVGKVQIQPYPIRFSDVRSCENLPATGGACRYSVRVTNRSGQPIHGAAWSVVNGETGSLAGNTTFQTANPLRKILRPGKSCVLNFRFVVPSTVPDGATICADGFFGEGNNHQPFFNTLARSGLFCLQKGVASATPATGAKALTSSGFSLLPKKDTAKLFQKRHSPPTESPRVK